MKVTIFRSALLWTRQPTRTTTLSMLGPLSLLLLAGASLSQAAFSNTFSLLAWSDDAQANLESFRPFASKGSQDYQVSLAQSQGEECIPALIVSAPSF